ncbi:MAG: biopolymer transporter ExbD [Gammaproteobacteria bacterium]|nr:biopolymer transporter ExbD [Gammaproteobacteria bacterium]
MNRRWRRNHLHHPEEMNITAFMNLMVVLVPFLLITAVFSRMTILHLDLPAEAAGAAPAAKPEFALEVIVRDNRIEVSERGVGGVDIAKQEGAAYDFKKVSGLLQDVKARHPDKTDVTLLVEPDIAYDTMVQVMDTLRVASIDDHGKRVRAELFPDISIGDAPVIVARNR